MSIRLRQIGSNQTQLDVDGVGEIFFSYETPVAACLADGSGFIRTSEFWSRTTSGHINRWLDGANAREVPQEELNALLDGAGRRPAPIHG